MRQARRRLPGRVLGDLTRNLPRPRSLDPYDIDTWDERIVMVADDERLCRVAA